MQIYSLKLNAEWNKLNRELQGAIIRDSQSYSVAASASYPHYVGNPTMAEAIAMRRGLIFADDLGCTFIQDKGG